MSCTDCERFKQSAAMWRNEAYKHAGTPLPWEPEELLRKAYERGYADAMNWKTQNHLEHLPSRHARAIDLLERAENEMRYAGWTKFESDNTARNGVYEQIKEFLK